MLTFYAEIKLRRAHIWYEAKKTPKRLVRRMPSGAAARRGGAPVWRIKKNPRDAPTTGVFDDVIMQIVWTLRQHAYGQPQNDAPFTFSLNYTPSDIAFQLQAWVLPRGLNLG